MSAGIQPGPAADPGGIAPEPPAVPAQRPRRPAKSAAAGARQVDDRPQAAGTPDVAVPDQPKQKKTKASKSSRAKSAEAKAPEAKAADTKPAGSKSGAPKPPETKAAGSKARGKAGAAKPARTSSKAKQAPATPAPAPAAGETPELEQDLDDGIDPVELLDPDDLADAPAACRRGPAANAEEEAADTQSTTVDYVLADRAAPTEDEAEDEADDTDDEVTQADPPQFDTDRKGESRWSSRDRAREQELLAMMAELDPDDPRRSAARDELVTMHMPLAAFLARRFRDRGEHLDDLTQVATVGLIKAVDRFEPGRGVEFSTFATPTIVGEIKRHFRDKGWAIRVPRRLQELRLSITRATAELSQLTGSSPTVAELAAHLGISDDEVLEGLESAAAYATVSLDSPTGDGSADSGSSIAETVGGHDPSLTEVEHRATLHPLLASLGEREQRIVYMRFYENKTQAQIAAEIGVSQMHISRLLAKSLAQMRQGLVET